MYVCLKKLSSFNYGLRE